MGDFFPEAGSHGYKDIPVGMTAQRDYVISQAVYEHFLAGFHDYSPLHVDEAFARARGFSGKVMHGTLLNGFLSHFVGMHFPGKHSLLLAVELRFTQPCYLGDVIQLDVKVRQKMDVQKVIVMDATFNNLTRNCIAARGRVQVMVGDSP